MHFSKPSIFRFLLVTTSLLLISTTASARLEYPVERTAEYLKGIVNSPYVSPTPSADLFEPGDQTPEALRRFTIGHTPGTEDGGYTWNDETVPAQDIYAFRITEGGETHQDKPKIIILSGQHPNESHSLYSLERSLDFLTSSDPKAEQARALADFYVYPQVNPEGRWAGSRRGNPQNRGEDNNRVWNDPEGWSNVELVRDAMFHDTKAENILYLFDYHSPGSSGSSTFHYTLRDDAASFWARSVQNEGMRLRFSSGHPGMIRIWSQTSPDEGGLGVQHGFTPEIGRTGDDTPADYFPWGEIMGRAMAKALIAHHSDHPTPSPVELLIDFNALSVPDADGWNVVGEVAHGQSVPLIDPQGKPTDLTLKLADDMEHSGSDGWNRSHSLPDWADPSAADSYIYFNDDARFVFQNLGANRVFDIEILAARDNNRRSTISVNGQSREWHDRDDGWNRGETLIFEGVSSDSQGNLAVDFQVHDRSGAVNAIRLREVTEQR